MFKFCINFCLFISIVFWTCLIDSSWFSNTCQTNTCIWCAVDTPESKHTCSLTEALYPVDIRNYACVYVCMCIGERKAEKELAIQNELRSSAMGASNTYRHCCKWIPTFIHACRHFSFILYIQQINGNKVECYAAYK